MNGKKIAISLAVLVAYCAIGGILISIYQSPTTITVYVTFMIICLLALVLLHKKSSYYICPDCDKMFEIGFFKDLLSANNGIKGKRLTCPKCGRKGWFLEYSNK